jgi:hypothetical protein
MAAPEEFWIPLVDEPIGAIVSEIQRQNPDIEQFDEAPRRLLAFRTFAYIRVGILLGQLLVEDDVEPYDGSGTWVDRLLQNPEHRELVVREVRAVAEEIAADPDYGDGPIGPDDATRGRFAEFAKRRLASDA